MMSTEQDLSLGITTSVTQADLGFMRSAGRLGDYAVVYRAPRNQQGGGFGDQDKYPLVWAVLVYVDGQAARVFSARGLAREWSNLARLEVWLREQGFWYWWMRNDLEPRGVPSSAPGEDDEES